MATPNNGGMRLVKCPRCFNLLPEVPNVPVYRCGGCGTILRAKIRPANSESMSQKQVWSDSDAGSSYSSLSSALPPPQDGHPGCLVVVDGGSSSAPNAQITPSKTEESSSHQTSDEALVDRRASECRISRSEEGCGLEERSSNSRADKAEDNKTDSYRKRNTSDAECSAHVAAESKVVSDLPHSEQRRVGEAEPVAVKHPHRSDIQDKPGTSASVSANFHSSQALLEQENDIDRQKDAAQKDATPKDANVIDENASSPRGALQSNSLEMRILKTVDELRGDLSELFGQSAERKPRTRPPRLPKQAMSSTLPLGAYHPAGDPSVRDNRLSKSGQAAFRGLPSRRYRRHRSDTFCHNAHTRPCPHDCCHHRPWTEEPRLAKAPVKEAKRRHPRLHCRPILRGAPFIICSSCFSLVQLPADFAVSRKRVRKLQCGSCSEVLSYTYRDPNSKRDDSDMSDIASARNAVLPQGDPISYSEDYGISFSETEHPLYVSRNSSFDTLDGRNGRLHRLMGYSSASELLRESFERRTPGAGPGRDRKGKGICMGSD